MKSALLCCLFFVCVFVTLHAQETVRPLQAAAGTSKNFTLDINTNSVLKNSTGDVLLELPDIDGGIVVARIERKDDFSPNYAIRNNQGSRTSVEQPVCYIGKLHSIPHSSVMILSRENYFYAVVFKDTRAYVIVRSRLTDVYSLQELNLEELIAAACGVSDDLPALRNDAASSDLWNDETTDKLKCVGIYFELGYDVYTAFQSSDANVLNYMNEMFGIVSLLFAREGIPTKISEVFIWHTPDPYQGPYQQVLYLFTQNTPVVNGQFGHLMKMPGAVTGASGVAWLNTSEQTFCSNTVQRAYSMLSIETINPFPLYTPTSRLVAHELGHNFGSHHTHYCYWPHGPFEVCGIAVEPPGCTATPQPVHPSGATIMSYCAANFVNGFGQYPGNVLRKSYLALPDSCQYICTVNVNGLVCPTPGNLQLQVNGNSCKATWTNPGVDSFYIELLAKNTSDPNAQWQLFADITTVNDSAVFSNLPGCTDYTVRLQSYCARRTGYFTVQAFSLPLPADNCVSSGTAVTNYIQALKVNDKENVSGNNSGLLNSCFTFHIQEGADNYFKFTPGVTANGESYYWRVWMDLDRDNIYDSVNELIHTSGPTTQVRKAAVYVPPPGIINPGGPFKMRVGMKKSAPSSSCETGFDGEVENYIINNDGYYPVPEYCFSEGNSDASAWISNVTVNGHLTNLNNPTGQSGGYAYYAGASKCRSDSTYTFSFTAKRILSFTKLYMHVWIDFNGDGYFDDKDETIFDQSVVPNQAYTGSFTVPHIEEGSRTRMRVIVSTQPIASACGIHEYGETEDYSVTIKGSSEPIGDPIVEYRVSGSDKIRVYPNPVNGRSFYCVINSTDQGKAVLMLTDMSGKLVYAGNYMQAITAIPMKINLPASVRPGIYFIRVQLNGKAYHQKIVLQ